MHACLSFLAFHYACVTAIVHEPEGVNGTTWGDKE